VGAILRNILPRTHAGAGILQARGALVDAAHVAQDVVDFFLKLEGPYKWYAIGITLGLLTALVTRFIFKTLKWFLIILPAAILVAAVMAYFADFSS
jgi:hypothetical protein